MNSPVHCVASHIGGNSLHAVRLVQLLNTQLAASQVQTKALAVIWGRSCLGPASHLIHTTLMLHRVRSPFPCKVSSCIQPPQL